MILFKKKLLLVFLLLSVILFSQQRKRPTDLKVKGDFTHPSTSVVFPALWSGFQRESVYSYDLQNNHLAIGYVQQKDKKTGLPSPCTSIQKDQLTTKFSGILFQRMNMPLIRTQIKGLI